MSLWVPWEERLYWILSIQTAYGVIDWILIDTSFHNRNLERAEMFTVWGYYVSKLKVEQGMYLLLRGLEKSEIETETWVDTVI